MWITTISKSVNNAVIKDEIHTAELSSLFDLLRAYEYDDEGILEIHIYRGEKNG